MTFPEVFVASRRLRFSIAKTNESIASEVERMKRILAITNYTRLHAKLVRDHEDKAAQLLNEVIRDMKSAK